MLDNAQKIETGINESVFKVYLRKTRSAEYIQCSLRTLSQRSEGNEKFTGMPGMCRPQR